MRPQKPFPRGTVEALQQLLKVTRTMADQRRIQAVLMRALDASPPERIAAESPDLLWVTVNEMIRAKLQEAGKLSVS